MQSHKELIIYLYAPRHVIRFGITISVVVNVALSPCAQFMYTMIRLRIKMTAGVIFHTTH
jgi:hypothetical protein